MKFALSKDVLADGVAWAARTVPSRPATPVMAGLRLHAEDGTVTVAAYDQEVFGSVTLAAEVPAAGSTVVSGKLLAEISKALPDRPVTLVAESGRVLLTCGTSKFSLPAMPLEDFPPLPEQPDVVGEVDGEALAEAVAQVAVAALRDDMLPVLTGIRLEMEGDRLTLAATDRYRLAVRELSWAPRNPGVSSVALVPARTLVDATRSLGTGPVELGLGEAGLLGIASADRRATTRLLDGEFPKYRTLFPDAPMTTVRLDAAALASSVRRVSLVAERNTPVRLTFNEGEVLLQAGRGEDAEAEETMPADVVGVGLGIGFNPGYLLDGLGAIDSSVAVMAFTEPGKPAVLQGAADDTSPPAADYRYLLMPVRLSG